MYKPFFTWSSNSASWEIGSCSSGQKLHRLLYKLKAHYRAQKTPPLSPILIPLVTAYTLTFCFSKICTKIISPFTPVSSKWSALPSGIPTTILYAFLITPMQARYSAHLNLLEHETQPNVIRFIKSKLVNVWVLVCIVIEYQEYWER